jgi:uncharacterized protein (DUF433 family)
MATEAILVQACPGIYFADEPAGRVAKISGTGLAVWEVIRDYKGVKRDKKKLGKWLPQLSSAQLKAATLFYAKCRDEIDAAIAEDTAAHAEGRATQKAFPHRT